MWSTIATGHDGDFWDLTFGDGQFVAVSLLGSVIFTSDDGIEWERAGTGVEDRGNARQIAYGNGQFLIVDDRGIHLVSRRRPSSIESLGEMRLELFSDGEVAAYLPAQAESGGVFRLEYGRNLRDWEVASDLTPLADGMLFRGQLLLDPEAGYFRAGVQK